MSKKQIDKMVDRFLCWPLPKDFAPDGRIFFDPSPDAAGYDPTWPVGTNLLTAVQARQMFEYALNGERESNIVTCVYCGHEYPDGTPTAKHELLTAHIKECEKHPMRSAEQKIAKLRSALIGLIGAEKPEELNQMEFIIRSTPAPEFDKIAAINAIDILRATA